MPHPRPVPRTVGEPAPWFFCRTQRRQRFAFDTIAGRYIVLSFFGSACAPASAALLESIRANRARFDDEHLSFFGVSVDPADEAENRTPDSLPGIRYFWDFDQAVSALYGAVDRAGAFRAITYVLDPALRVLAVVPFSADAGAHVSALHAVLEKLPKIGSPRPAAAQAPVLVVPRIFEPKFCRMLVDYYGIHGGQESGFMRDVAGKTVALLDPEHKRRQDCVIEDAALSGACMLRIRERLAPEIRKAFQFAATRMERYVISCYDARDGGHFRAHRDNATKGTLHRSSGRAFTRRRQGAPWPLPAHCCMRRPPSPGDGATCSCPSSTTMPRHAFGKKTVPFWILRPPLRCARSRNPRPAGESNAQETRWPERGLLVAPSFAGRGVVFERRTS